MDVKRDPIEELAAFYQVLADPTRLRLIQLLVSSNICVNGLATELGVSQSAVSQHLRVLRQAGLVNTERRGLHVHYSLNGEAFEHYSARASELFGKSRIGGCVPKAKKRG